MKVSFKIVFLLFFIILLESCVFQPGNPLYAGAKDSCNFAVNQYSGQGLRWEEKRFPISFYVHRSVPAEAKSNFISAISHWNLSWADYLENQGLRPFHLFSVVDANNLYNGNPGSDEYNFLFFIDKDFSKYENNSSTQAITAIASSGNKIKDTDIIVNSEVFQFYYDDSYNNEITLAANKMKEIRGIAGSRAPDLKFRFFDWLKSWVKIFLKPFIKHKKARAIAAVSPKVPRNKVDFPSLIIHELGHAPGMAHFHEDDLDSSHQNHYASRRNRTPASGNYISVMEPKLSLGRARRQVKEHDLENMFCAYFNY